ncbi:hypothetical protein N6L27_10415 [Leisingera sp. SS27]|uniref:hypothetical protein n=1 Tax=Leisingera sp. SS27 TaxID=2979462 RepID=UPI00232C87E0|nr:hypothetical protein [Leisingera sp. SS27]MDC0658409.1 hypothetical protein [Leisingera sp. SS27]
MKRTTAFAISGAAIGFFAGSSMGIATGGDAYNAAVFLTPLGAFVGWVLALRNSAISSANEDTVQSKASTEDPARTQSNVPQLVEGALALLASMWNFQIDMLKAIGLLDTFVRQPMLFAGLAIVISVFLPPFLPVYFCAWLGANHFGLSKENSYRVAVK